MYFNTENLHDFTVLDFFRREGNSTILQNMAYISLHVKFLIIKNGICSFLLKSELLILYMFLDCKKRNLLLKVCQMLFSITANGRIIERHLQGERVKYTSQKLLIGYILSPFYNRHGMRQV